jgi:hypothetical protein
MVGADMTAPEDISDQVLLKVKIFKHLISDKGDTY